MMEEKIHALFGLLHLQPNLEINGTEYCFRVVSPRPSLDLAYVYHHTLVRYRSCSRAGGVLKLCLLGR